MPKRSKYPELRMPMSYAEASAIEKTLVSKVNIGPPDTGPMGAHMIETYKTADGRTLVNEWGMGWGTWYFHAETI